MLSLYFKLLLIKIYYIIYFKKHYLIVKRLLTLKNFITRFRVLIFYKVIKAILLIKEDKFNLNYKFK